MSCTRTNIATGGMNLICDHTHGLQLIAVIPTITLSAPLVVESPLFVYSSLFIHVPESL